MTEEINQAHPTEYEAIGEATRRAGFTMASDVLTGSLLRTLAASKPGGAFLELGTGTGLSTSWILDGMDQNSTLISVDHDDNFLDVARNFLGNDRRLKLVCADGEDWIRQHAGSRFDFIFADSWHGKYLMLDEALEMLKPGGLYVIDDMLPQANWPEGHDAKAKRLIDELENNDQLTLTKQCWSTGIIIATKKA